MPLPINGPALAILVGCFLFALLKALLQEPLQALLALLLLRQQEYADHIICAVKMGNAIY